MAITEEVLDSQEFLRWVYEDWCKALPTTRPIVVVPKKGKTSNLQQATNKESKC